MQILPQMLQTADGYLRRLSLRPFWPEIEVGGKHTRTEPMFRGYGFVRLDLETDPWYQIRTTPGVVGLLPRHSQIPLPMPTKLIENLRCCSPMRAADFAEVLEEYVPGVTEVEIRDHHGLLGGRRGLVAAVRNRMLQVVLSEYSDRPVWLAKNDVRLIS